MATFSKQTEVTCKFDNGDIYNVGLSLSKYAPYIMIQTRNDETVKLGFTNNDDLHHFLNVLVSAVSKINWDEEYDTQYGYMNDAASIALTVEQIAEWKQAANTPLSELVAKLTEQEKAQFDERLAHQDALQRDA